MKLYALILTSLLSASAIAQEAAEPPATQAPTAAEAPAAEVPATEVPAAPTVQAPAVEQKSAEQSPAPASAYDDWIKQAREALLTPKANDSGGNGPRSRFRQAAQAFELAASVAPDDIKKFSAYMLAGEYYAQVEQFDKAANVYQQASQVATSNDTQRSQALLMTAEAAFARDRERLQEPGVADAVRSSYEAVLKTKELENETREHALRGIAYTWSAQGDAVNAALTFEKLSNLPQLTPNQAVSILRDAAMLLDKAPRVDLKSGAPLAAALLDRIFPRLLKAENDVNHIADLQLRWGDLLVKYGQPARAYIVWARMADDAKAPLWQRARAISAIATQRIIEKDAAAGIQAWERTAQWPAPGAKEPNWVVIRAYSKADLYTATGDEVAARRALEVLSKTPGLDATELIEAQYAIARSHLRERDSLRLKKGTPKDISAHEVAAQAILDKILATQNIGSEVRYQTTLTRAQMDIDKNQNDQARKLLLSTVAALEKSGTDFTLPLMKAVAKSYYLEKRYADATAALADAMAKTGPDPEANRIAGQLLREALDNQKWTEARNSLDILKPLGISEIDYNLLLLQIEVSAQNWEGASKALTVLNTLTLDEQTAKLKTELAAKIPSETPKPATDAAKPENLNPPAAPADQPVTAPAMSPAQ